MDIGIYVLPQFLKKGEINNILNLFSRNLINQIHISFNDNYLIEDISIKDSLFFKPDISYYQVNKKLLQYSQNHWHKLQKLIDNAYKNDFKVIAWLNCLENPKAISIYPDWAQINHLGEVNNRFLCPNNPAVQNYFSDLITNIIEQYQIHGIELFNIRFPFPYKEDLCCFCESCQREALNPRALENLKEREIINETWKGFSIKQLRKYFSKNSELLSKTTLNQDSIFLSWNRFRYNSITRFVGKLLIKTRQIDQKVTLGTDVWPSSTAELIGQNYADLATYQDVIYQILFLNNDKQSQKHARIIKEILELKKLIKKARGLKKFFLSVKINDQINKDELKKIIDALKEIKANGIVFFPYKETYKFNVNLIGDCLKTR